MNSQALYKVKYEELSKLLDDNFNPSIFAACIISETLGNRLDELNRNISEMNRLMQEQLK